MDAFRDETETLRAQLARTERELEEAKREIVRLEAELHPPPPLPRGTSRAPESHTGAHLATVVFAFAAAGYFLSLHTPASVLSQPLLVATSVTGLVSLVLGTLIVHHACDTPFSYTLFATVFWVPFCAIPYAGGVIALIRVIILLRGKFSAATITTNGDSTSYDAMDIGRAGVPLAMFFLVAACIHGVVLYGATR